MSADDERRRLVLRDAHLVSGDWLGDGFHSRHVRADLDLLAAQGLVEYRGYGRWQRTPAGDAQLGEVREVIE